MIFNVFLFSLKGYSEALKNLLLFETCAREIYPKFVYKHSETTEYVKNSLIFMKLTNFTGK